MWLSSLLGWLLCCVGVTVQLTGCWLLCWCDCPVNWVLTVVLVLVSNWLGVSYFAVLVWLSTSLGDAGCWLFCCVGVTVQLTGCWLSCCVGVSVTGDGQQREATSPPSQSGGEAAQRQDQGEDQSRHFCHLQLSSHHTCICCSSGNWWTSVHTLTSAHVIICTTLTLIRAQVTCTLHTHWLQHR